MFSAQAFTAAGIVQDSLRLHLDAGNAYSYNTTGSAWKDLSIQGSDGSIAGPTAFSSANGGVIDVKGTSSTTTFPTTATGPNGTFFQSSSFTIQFDVATTTPSTNQAWFFQGAGANNQGLHGVTRSGGKVLFGMFNNDLTSNGTLTAGAWTNLAFVYYNETGFRKEIYINGVLDIAAAGTKYAPANLNNFGLWKVGWAGYNEQYFIGQMSNFLIYSRPLNSSEIYQNFVATKNRFGKF